MKKFLAVIGVALSAGLVGYLARDGLEMKGFKIDTTLPNVAPSTSATQRAADSPTTAPLPVHPAATEGGEYYDERPTIRLVPTWPQYVDPAPRNDRIATPTILNGIADR